MASVKNKMVKKNRKKQNAEKSAEIVSLKKKMLQQYEAEAYVEAMDTMAEIAKLKVMDPEIMAMGASCYFNTGDYDRTATWINNTLKYDPANVKARILLSRLCFIQDRINEGFSILSFILEKLQAGMTDKEKKDLGDIIGYCHENMAEEMSQYTTIEEYFKNNYTPKATMNSSIQDMLEASLPPAEVKPADNSKAQAAVERLKALLKKNKNEAHKNEGSKSEEVKSEGIKGDNTESVICEVMGKPVSLKERIRLLNAFAGSMYVKGDNEAAFKLLEKALEIDQQDATVLKNMAYVCLSMNDKEKAIELASKMPELDFSLLRSIRG